MLRLHRKLRGSPLHRLKTNPDIASSSFVKPAAYITHIAAESLSACLFVRGRRSFSLVGGSVCTNALVFTSWRYRKCVWRTQEVTHVWSSTALEQQLPPPPWTSRVRRPIRFNFITPDRIIWYLAEWIFVSCFCPQVFLRTPPGESLSDFTYKTITNTRCFKLTTIKMESKVSVCWSWWSSCRSVPPAEASQTRASHLKEDRAAPSAPSPPAEQPRLREKEQPSLPSASWRSRPDVQLPLVAERKPAAAQVRGAADV